MNPNGSTTAAWFEWGLSASYGNTTAPAQSLGQGVQPMAVSRQISGLSPNVLYHYRCAASNALGVVRGLDQRFVPSATAGTDIDPPDRRVLRTIAGVARLALPSTWKNLTAFPAVRNDSLLVC